MNCQLPSSPQAPRLLVILNRHLRQRGCTPAVAVPRLPEGRPGLVFALDAMLSREEFRLAMTQPGRLEVAAGSELGLIFGLGKMLRTGRFADGEFVFGGWRGSDRPQGTVRGMYYASHFHNWYHVASDEELTWYTEDLALWGVNTLMAIFPAINLESWDDPATEPALERLRRLGGMARELGMGFATMVNNTWFRGTPKPLLAAPLPDPTQRHGNSGFPICPGRPAGMALILNNCRQLFERLAPAELDYLCLWPYDEGGCACPACRPWGANGYYRMSREISRLAKQQFPKLKVILSTWTFDSPEEGEWAGLARQLAQGNDWLDYLLADAHENFPAYPLRYPAPGGLPFLNFPEISMWELFPWGGYGANPLPLRLQRLWRQAGHLLAGGFPYSEGIFEDLNKVVAVRFYWNRNLTAQQTLAEYVAYEFSPAVVDDVLRIIRQLESAHMQAALAGVRARVEQLRGKPDHQAGAHEAENVLHLLESALAEENLPQALDKGEIHAVYSLAETVAAKLPAWAATGWRWRILYLRALLDRERLAGGGLATPAAGAALRELTEIFHARLEDDGSDPYHHRVRPPLETGAAPLPLRQ
ncbi:MAG: hypothetical protein WC708_15070 [Lentisphaeria bacterium]